MVLLGAGDLESKLCPSESNRTLRELTYIVQTHRELRHTPRHHPLVYWGIGLSQHLPSRVPVLAPDAQNPAGEHGGRAPSMENWNPKGEAAVGEEGQSQVLKSLGPTLRNLI